MPNLDYDPQNPTDLIGQRIAAGDYVGWGTTWGKSPALCVARIERVRFFQRPGGSYGRTIECDQAVAEGYNLVLRPLKSTGDITWEDKTSEKRWVRDDDVKADPRRYEAKTKTIQHVKNVVKLDYVMVEALLLRPA